MGIGIYEAPKQGDRAGQVISLALRRGLPRVCVMFHGEVREWYFDL
jgi:hypothetical protein